MIGETQPGSSTYYLLGLDVIGQQQGANWTYFGYDGLGSVRQVTNSAGTIGYSANYDPYGNPLEQFGTLPTNLGFTGEYTDPSGLLYLRARYANLSTATFLTRDPFEGYMQRAMSRNGYSYVEGNPVNYADPSGRVVPLVGAGIGAVLGAGVGAATSVRMWDLANSGECGCEAKQWAEQTDRTQYVAGETLKGMLLGGVTGFLATTPVAPILAVGGTALSAKIAFEAQQALEGGGPNACTQLLRDLGILGAASGLVGAGLGIRVTPGGSALATNEGFVFAGAGAQISADISAGAGSALVGGIVYTVGGSGGDTPIPPPTNRNGLRENLKKAGINEPADYIKPQVHHDLPWHFRQWFARRGLNVNHVQFGRWVEGGPVGSHQRWSALYNKTWLEFILNNPDATQAKVLTELARLRTSGQFPSK